MSFSHFPLSALDTQSFFLLSSPWLLCQWLLGQVEVFNFGTIKIIDEVGPWLIVCAFEISSKNFFLNLESQQN